MCRAAIGSRWSEKIDDLNQIIAEADARMYEDKKTFYRTHPASNRYRHHSDCLLYTSQEGKGRQEEVGRCPLPTSPAAARAGSSGERAPSIEMPEAV